ncbi:F-box-like/WD repeat-containing protein TBL1XR1-A [Daphnia magna]|uniref:F-box-like/WD repeat-containing protein TBL1XR1-A n=1 Tax=Daphnia magna TaxID=35525 RepID=UPI001E1BC882|nr:F-box-like/WD repeat-containing protein TBL1XR1-A [Daphnia magna]
MSLHGKYSIRFHPTKLIVACADNKELIFYTAENSSIPFSNWRKEVRCLPLNLVGKRVKAPEWNINGTQLAFGVGDGTLVVWSYPKCEILFQRSIYVRFDYRPLMEWNPTRPNLFATFLCDENQVLLCDSSVGDVITTIDSEGVRAVNWISENRIAVSSFRRTIQIFEIDENNLTINRLVKEFRNGYGCHYLEWNERTQYLASVGGGRINIWSMDHDTPIYSMKTLEVDEIHSFAWRPCIGNGEEKDGIEMARKSVKNFFFAYASISNGVFIWNPLESEQQPRRLSEDTDIGTVAFSSDGRFLAAGSRGKLMIWSAEDWEQIDTHSKCNDEITDFSWLCTKTSTNLYENKLIVNHGYGPIAVLEYAFEESEVSDSANQILTESN